MAAEAKLRELGIKLPDYSVKPFAGIAYGRMKPFHMLAKVLALAGRMSWKEPSIRELAIWVKDRVIGNSSPGTDSIRT